MKTCSHPECYVESDHIHSAFTGNEIIKLGEACEHGSLKRQCLTCELEAQLRAADKLAKVAWGIRLDYTIDGLAYVKGCDLLHKALETYESLRGKQ
jgi:hypothetical protein